MILADKIIEQRKKNGWSQEELAEKMDGAASPFPNGKARSPCPIWAASSCSRSFSASAPITY